MSEIKALPTTYANINFRSRLEARWAVFFDSLGIGWEYEPKTFQLPSGRYTPDFHLPELNCYFEVKPNIDVGKQATKCHELAEYLNENIIDDDYDDTYDRDDEDFYNTRYLVYVMYGNIIIPSLVDRSTYPLNMECEAYEGSSGDPSGEYYWGEFMETREINIYHAREVEPFEKNISRPMGQSTRKIYDTPRLCKAYFLARTINLDQPTSRVDRIMFNNYDINNSVF